MKAEFQQKHHQKSKMKKEIRSVDFSLRTSLNVILYKCVIHQINEKQIQSTISKGHLKKLDKLWRGKTLMRNEEKPSVKHTAHNSSVMYYINPHMFKHSIEANFQQ